MPESESESKPKKESLALPTTESRLAYNNGPLQPTLQSGRLILRPFEASDADCVNALLVDREIAANTSEITFPYSVELAQNWIKPQASNWQTGTAAVFAICLSQSGDAQQSAGAEYLRRSPVIGAIGLEIDSFNERAELGYWIGKQSWGHGYCTEAAITVIKFSFEVLALNRIFAYHLTRNKASGRVMKKAGMKCEGILKQHTKKWGKFEDVAIWGIVK